MNEDGTLTTTPSVVTVYPNNHIDPPISHGLVLILLVVWLGCLVSSFRKRAQALKTAAEADAGVDEGAALYAGARFVAGIVEYAEGETSAVEVHVRQNGADYRVKNGWRHKWSEVGRTTHAHPFYIRRQDGQRVRVEPGVDAFLVDEPDHMIWTERTNRTRIARLSPGEKVIVEGELTRGHDPELREGAYRSDGRGWVMRPPRDYPIHISAEPLGERHRLRAKAFRNAILGLFICGALSFATLSTYYARALASRLTTADIMHKDSYVTTDGKGNRTTHYRVYLSITWPSVTVIDRELDYDDWKAINRGQTVDLRYVTSWPWASNVGRSSSIHFGAWVFALFTGIVGVGIYFGAVGYHRWYEGKLEDDAAGQLPFPPPGGPAP